MYFVYLNLVVREIVNDILGNDLCIYLIELLDVIDFYNFVECVYIILIDLGGV